MRSYLLSTLVVLSLITTGACRSRADKVGDEPATSPTAASQGSSNPDKADAKVERKVKRLIADELGLEEDEVGLDASLMDDLDADDLDTASVIMRLEEEFNIVVPDEDVEKMKTVRDMCEYVKQHHKK